MTSEVKMLTQIPEETDMSSMLLTTQHWQDFFTEVYFGNYSDDTVALYW